MTRSTAYETRIERHGSEGLKRWGRGKRLPGCECSSVAEADLPVAIDPVEMDAAYEGGEATPYAASVPWLMRYRSAWWVVCDIGWLRVGDGLKTNEVAGDRRRSAR